VITYGKALLGRENADWPTIVRRKIPANLLLRLYCSLRDPALRCRWALLADGKPPLLGDSPLGALPQRAGRVQLVIPAAQTLLTRAYLPQAAKRRNSPVLAFAAEEAILGEPEAHRVSWLGTSGDADVLAVIDNSDQQRWLDALAASGIPSCEVHSEILLLPWDTGEWSLAWDGQEGFVRCGEFEGAATDRGDRSSPFPCA
jgi:general secretion pathway protein L